MKILLYNDNPVVRKLVALSAQKTKDDLNVIWSIDELDNGSYDLLIVDDALYSDEIMGELKARVPFKSTLMMATRGSSVPAGFDKVIHKPFLPTDLVDLFSQIEKSISAPSAPEAAVKTNVKAINLEDEMDDLNDTIAIDDLPDLEDLDFEEHSSEIKTNILDHEEVQEVQSLLDDEDAFVLDEPHLDEDTLLDGIEENIQSDLEDDFSDMLDKMDIEEHTLEGNPEMLDIQTDELDALMSSLEEESDAEESSSPPALEEEIDMGDLIDEFEEETIDPVEESVSNSEEIPEMDEDDFGLGEEELGTSDLEDLSTSLEDEELMDDQGMDELEQKIQEAVNELDLEDLNIELDDGQMDDLGITERSSFEGLEGLEEIDEREMKRAVGESVEDENTFEPLEPFIADAAEELIVEDKIMDDQKTPASADGVEALQVLLKTLSNEEVVKSLKGMNISININFGNNS